MRRCLQQTPTIRRTLRSDVFGNKPKRKLSVVNQLRYQKIILHHHFAFFCITQFGFCQKLGRSCQVFRDFYKLPEAAAPTGMRGMLKRLRCVCVPTDVGFLRLQNILWILWMEEILHQLKTVVDPIMDRVSTILLVVQEVIHSIKHMGLPENRDIPSTNDLNDENL